MPIASKKVLEIQQPLEQNRFVRGVSRGVQVLEALDSFVRKGRKESIEVRWQISDMNSPKLLPLESDFAGGSIGSLGERRITGAQEARRDCLWSR